MKTIFAKKLKSGDEIRVIAPSSSAATLKPLIRKNGIARAQKILGLKASFSKNSAEKGLFLSPSIKSRITDLHEAFKNKNIKGIACVRGGYSANTLLPYIDWNLIKKNPKPLWGYSDITVLANAIYTKTGLVTYSGPNFSVFGMKDEKGQMEYIFDSFAKCLLSEVPYSITSSKYFGGRKTKAVKNKGQIVIREGKATGTIVGGNLCSFNLLQGTEYMPSLKDKVLFIEDDDFGGDQSWLEFERNLESLLQLPDANTIRGIVFGRFPKKAKMDLKKLQFMLRSISLPKNIPIIADADFGHTTPMITFPIGGTVRIEAIGKKSVIEILKH